MRSNAILQLNPLKTKISRLWEVSTLINFLHTRTDLEQIEPCEMEQALNGIETLLNQYITEIENSIAFILVEEVKND
ncbi:hypothetical protein [Rodentibacter pneumotropicus]|uniref:hypothetical protein n=1 Tax=Rodentibacter pneumotropicus TaxID=758 RepID=UPI0009862BF8|nr:hypothetical protein [Rodentibacter pneumotropicus]OOF62375.1 hypothetical protein BKL50_05910 [Rodentibacter pneumotropicus]THA19004.1 hypothetical protein D3M83_02360 [Rodentibacter pneumotropicus]